MNKSQRNELMQILIVGLFIFGFIFINFEIGSEFTGMVGGDFRIQANCGDGVGACSCGDTLTADYTLTEDLDCTASAQGLYLSDNVDLDCAQYLIKGGAGGYGIHLNGVNTATVSNCVVDRFTSGIYLYGFSNNNRFLNNRIWNSTSMAILFISAPNNTFINNTITSVGDAGFDLTSNSHNITLINNTVRSATNMAFYSQTSHNNTVFNNGFFDSNQGAFVNSNFNNFTKNKFDNNTREGFELYSGANNVFINNTFNNNSGGGIYTRFSTYNNFTSNIIKNNTYKGIKLFDTSTDNVLTSNNVSNPDTWDIVVSSDSIDNNFYNNTLSYNRIYNTTFSFTEYFGDINITGIGVAPAGSGLWNLSKYLNITNSSRAGFNLSINYLENELGSVAEDNLMVYRYDGSDWKNLTATTIDTNKNLIYGNLTEFSIFGIFGEKACGDAVTASYTLTTNLGPCNNNGLTISADSVTLDCAGYSILGVNGTASNASHYGITIDGYNSATLKNCNVTNFSIGTYMNDADNGFLINNTFNRNWIGARLWSDSNYTIIENNTIKLSNFTGMHVRESAFNNITNNTITDNLADYGLYLHLTANDNLITNNTLIRNYGGMLVYYTCDNNLIANNTIHNSLTDGIFAWFGTMDNNTIINNLIYNNTYHGIYLTNITNTTVENNIIENNTQTGIYIEDSINSTIFNNTIFNNSDYGIYLNESFNSTIYLNLIENNSDTGIYLNNSNYNNISSNTIIENINYGIYVKSSDYNNITTNLIINNTDGVGIFNSDSCILKDNNFSNPNYCDIVIDSTSNDNEFYNNTLSYDDIYNTTFSFTEYYGDVNITRVSDVLGGSDLNNISLYLNITNSSAAGLNISINYIDSDITGLTESRFGIYRYSDDWSLIPTRVDTSRNLIFGNITDFSIFGVFESEAPPAPPPEPAPSSPSPPAPSPTTEPEPEPAPTVETPGEAVTEEETQADELVNDMNLETPEIEALVAPLALEIIKGAIIPDYIRSYLDNETLIIDAGGKGELNIGFEDEKPRFDFNLFGAEEKVHYELPKGINWFYWKYAGIILCLFILFKLFFVDREVGFVEQDEVFEESVKIPEKKVFREIPVLIKPKIDIVSLKSQLKKIKVPERKLELEKIKVKPKYREIEGEDVFDVRYCRNIKKKLTKVSVRPEKLELDRVNVKPKYRIRVIKGREINHDIGKLNKMSELIRKGKILKLKKKIYK